MSEADAIFKVRNICWELEESQLYEVFVCINSVLWFCFYLDECISMMAACTCLLII